VGGRSPRCGACAVRSATPCAASPPTLTLPHNGGREIATKTAGVHAVCKIISSAPQPWAGMWLPLRGVQIAQHQNWRVGLVSERPLNERLHDISLPRHVRLPVAGRGLKTRATEAKNRRNPPTGSHLLSLRRGRRRRTQSELPLALRVGRGRRGRDRFRTACISEWLKLTSASAFLPAFALRKQASPPLIRGDGGGVSAQPSTWDQTSACPVVGGFPVTPPGPPLSRGGKARGPWAACSGGDCRRQQTGRRIEGLALRSGGQRSAIVRPENGKRSR
jgi:hypothetical protein